MPELFSTSEPIAIFWYRRDLRIRDNAGLFHALQSGFRVLPIFVFDTEILDRLDERKDRRIEFITGALNELQKIFVEAGSSIAVYHTLPEVAFRMLLSEYNVKAVYANRDYEPGAISRDKNMAEMLRASGIPFHTFKDQVLFEENEVRKADGTPYTVYTPYSKAWKKLLTADSVRSFPSEDLAGNLMKTDPLTIPSPVDLGFVSTGYHYSLPVVKTEIISDYHKTRNYPSIEGTTRLGVHLRFGTVSVREIVLTALHLNEVWLNELIWREFFMSILWHFPHVAEHSFKRKYDNISWRNNEDEFERWCSGMTGFPIVDAGMRQLNETGFMHNRARMITAGFLTKDLLIDWRWGEAYFAQKLLDLELSSNNGNWQWAAGRGCDAAPYFRVFSPDEQTRKFDPDKLYIKKWIPEFGTDSYPQPVVDHRSARERAVMTYRETLQ
ncbi:MAG: deoxyribodipyrimidine photo-lyase [Bacteroidia bacterium]|nr:MAG: deoxyribodipyrimidine photo-lyase [Bacteroidia bacterium]